MSDGGEFSDLLRTLRASARRSQMDLALAAEISQRHLSFLETGRSRPGRAVVEKLARALELPPALANALMASAGFAPLFQARTWDDDALAPLRRAAAEILQRHAPYPAVLIDAAANVIAINPDFDRALGLIDGPARLWSLTHAQGQPRNLLRLSLHPDGPARAMVNFPDVARATLQRAQAEARGSRALLRVLEEIARWRNIDPAWLEPAWAPAPGPIIEERYRIGDRQLALFAVVTTLGAPMDATAGALRIESFFPADEDTRRALAGDAPK